MIVWHILHSGLVLSEGVNCNPEKGDGYIQERRLEIKPAEGPEFQGMAP